MTRFVLKFSSLVATSMLALAGASHAAEARPLARAEVVADLVVWQQSGMAAFDNGEAADFFSPAREAAHARYQALRDAPEFAQLVERIASGEPLRTVAKR